MEKQAKIQWSQIVELPTDCLIPFKNHPFKVVTDYQMIQLTESIRECGILTPLIVRPEVNGKYEIISGHRRKHAAEQLGMTMVPAIIRNGKYTEAVVEMVDSNLHREMILPSEKAYAYKMKYETLRVHGKKVRRSHVDENGEPLIGMRAVDIVGKDIGESPKQLQRYIKLTNLIPELMEKLDVKKGDVLFYSVECLKPKEYASLYIPDYTVERYGTEAVAAEALREYGWNTYDENIKCPDIVRLKVLKELSGMEQELFLMDANYLYRCRKQFKHYYEGKEVPHWADSKTAEGVVDNRSKGSHLILM